MKKISSFLFTNVIVPLVFFQQLAFAKANNEFKVVYSGKIPSTENYSIKLLIPKEWNDPGDYTQLLISKNGKTVFSLKDLQASKLENIHDFPKGAKSIGKYLKIFPLVIKAKSSTMLLALSNWVGGSQDDEVILLAIDTNKVTQVFRKSIDILSIRDFDGDGLFDLLKSGARGEPVGVNNFSYDPYLVYRQVQTAGAFEFLVDERLSKKWSAENKFYWHGSQYDEKIRVDKSGELAPQE